MCNLGGERGQILPQYFLYIRIFFGYSFEEGQIKKIAMIVGERGVYILRAG
jgi:hypothetical protein